MKRLILMILVMALLAASGCASDCSQLRNNLAAAKMTVLDIPAGAADDVVNSVNRVIADGEQIYREKCR